MVELKTQLTTQSVHAFLKTVIPEDKRRDSLEILAMMEKTTGEKAQMWGTSIVGFGKYHYKSKRSTQEGDWPLVGFSPRKQNLTFYLVSGFAEDTEQLKKLGKHKTSVGCLYIKRLADVDKSVLAKLIHVSYKRMKALYP